MQHRALLLAVTTAVLSTSAMAFLAGPAARAPLHALRAGASAPLSRTQLRIGAAVAPMGGAPRARHSTSFSPMCTAAAEGVGAGSGLALAGGRMKVREIVESDDVVGKEVVLKGWVRTVRNQKAFSFVEVNDGSTQKGIQVVANSDIASYAEVEKLCTGSAVAIKGTIAESPGKGQKYEIEFLRSIAHLRPRTNTIASVSRVRSALAQATHAFFQSKGFYYVQTPIITASDCEGAGELFRVTTLPTEIDKIPKTKKGEMDFSEDFFGKPAYLTVSGQLAGETYATALGDIYTFGPTFRAENSQTTKHLAEFWMIEPELAFCDLEGDMQNAEAFVKHVVKYAMETCPDDLAFFNSFYDKTLLDRLDNLVNKPFARVEYSKAIELLQEEIAKDPSKWQFPDVKFGTDLQTEHERWLAETKFKTATFVYNYPREIKAFYMRDNDDGKTVAAMDLLVPGIGELIGGSQREERLEVLRKKLTEFGLNEEDYWWYMDLRKYGSVPHAGYGLGFERLVCYVTAVENIRDAIAYPRYPGSAEF